MKTKEKISTVLFLGFILLVGYIPQTNAQTDKISISKINTDEISTDKAHIKADIMPEYPGGMEALMEFIKTNLKYPEEAQKQGIQGRVTVRFIIAKDGQVTDINVIRGFDPACDAEAIRVIQAMPKWIPGKENGKNVPVYFNLPIQFKLTKDSVKDNRDEVYISNEKEISKEEYTAMVEKARSTNRIMVEKVLSDAEAIQKLGDSIKNKKVIEVKIADRK